jgi:putative oxidoreductase
MILLQKLWHLPISAKTRLVIVDTISYLFILLFMYTAANKIWEFHNFEWVLSTLPVIGSFSELIAYSIPAAEIIASLLLLSYTGRHLGLILSCLLMLGFTTYLLFMIIYTDNLPCNCGGVLSQLSWKQHIAFNLFFLLLSFIAIRLNQDIVRAKQAKR